MSRRKYQKGIYVVAMTLSLAACAGGVNVKDEAACAKGLDDAFQALENAKATGLSDSVAITKATSLLTAAKIQQQFEKYPNCIDKVERARQYISGVEN